MKSNLLSDLPAKKFKNAPGLKRRILSSTRPFFSVSTHTPKPCAGKKSVCTLFSIIFGFFKKAYFCEITVKQERLKKKNVPKPKQPSSASEVFLKTLMAP
jgi:hypothetical protein